MQAELVELLRGVAGYQDVRVRDEPLDQRTPILGKHVERDTELVAVEVDELRALLDIGYIAGEVAEAAGVVAFRRFDLDDLGAEVCEELGGRGAGEALAQFKDTDAM